MKKIKGYGWKPDLPDGRDKLYKIQRPSLQLQSVDLRNTHIMPEIFDQGNLGSCTSNAIAFCLAFNVLNKHTQVQAEISLPFSRLFIYYNERLIENSIKEDAGAEIRNGIKSIAHEGVCSELLKPYREKTFKRIPSKKAYAQALKFTALDYQRLDNSYKPQLVDCLMEGYPFVLGFTVYNSFESNEVARTGVVPIPNFNTDYAIGGHAVACVGYDASTDRFICVNSWSEQWGDKGYFTIPAAYLCNLNLSDDYWRINTIK